uniref:GST C-terminal domain-containing protein n=1 Tax=Anopheles christyi TaxID=43041 RepID=A0A182JPP3_9DIPT
NWCGERIRSANEISELNPAFYLTTEFILHLNELIKQLAVYSLDDTIDSRDTIEHAGDMWNHTQAALEELVHRSAFVGSNITNFALHGALEEIRLEKSNFMMRLGNVKNEVEISATSLIDRSGQYHAASSDAMQPSVHRLTNVSARLLHVLEAISIDNSDGTGRANPTNASIELFLTVWDRAIVDTQRNFKTQIDRALRRVKAQLSSLDTTTALGQYLMKLAELYALFKTDVTAKLALIATSVRMKMEDYSTTIDSQLTAGISDLLLAAGTSSVHTFLYLCLKRYVYSYFDESLAVGKLLYCGEPEIATLEYLVTVAGPILERAAVSDSSAEKMSIICSSTPCTDFDWPRDAVLYQPYEEEQILLAENASCLAVRTYMKMLNLPVALEQRANAEFMSPGGKRTKLPVLRVENFIYAEFDHIVTFLEKNFTKSLSAPLTPEEKDQMRSTNCLVEHLFTTAEQYISWVDPEVRDTVTKKRNGCVFPFPLNYVQNWRKESAVRRQLRMADYLNEGLDTIIGEVDHLCQDLSVRLGDKRYFFGDSPTELDALVFGHLYSIFTMKLPNNVLALTIHKYSNLNQFCKNIDETYFSVKGK